MNRNYLKKSASTITKGTTNKDNEKSTRREIPQSKNLTFKQNVGHVSNYCSSERLKTYTHT